MHRSTINFKALLAASLVCFLFSSSLVRASENSDPLASSNTAKKRKIEAHDDQDPKKRFKLDPEFLIDKTELKVSPKTEFLSADVLENGVFPYLSPMEKWQFLQSSQIICNQYFKSDSQTDIDQGLQKLKDKGNEYKDYFTIEDPIENYFISQFNMNRILDITYSLNEAQKNENMKSALPELIRYHFYQLLNSCLMPKASIARTQALKLIGMYVSEKSFLKIRKKGVFAMLFVEYLQKHGAEQVRDLITQNFGNSSEKFRSRCTFELGLRRKERTRRQEYTTAKKLLQRQEIPEISQLTDEQLTILSCFHQASDIQTEALSVLFEKTSWGSNLPNWQDPLKRKELNFLLSVSASTTKTDLIKQYTKITSPNTIGSTDSLEKLLYLYEYGDKIGKQAITVLLKEMSLSAAPDMSAFSFIYLEGKEEIRQSITPLLRESLLRELSQSGDKNTSESAFNALSIIYRNGNEDVRQSITPLFINLGITLPPLT